MAAETVARPWVRIPRLEQILQCRPDELTWDHVEELVIRKTAEDLTLDFKGSVYEYSDKGKQELAKDTAALANAAGGLIILGIAEDGQARAQTLRRVKLTDNERGRMVEIMTRNVAPLLPDVNIWELRDPQDDARGVYLVLVAPSDVAPHSIRLTAPGVQNGDAFAWPVREDRFTRWMSEAELARRYRDRFAGAARQVDRLELATREGVSRLPRAGLAWATLTVSPSRLGYLPGDPEQYRQWLTTLADRPAWPTPIQAGGARVGRRRIVMTTTPHAPTTDQYLELHTDGAGFAALVLPEESDGRNGCRVDDLAAWVLGSLDILARHAVNTGAGGDLAVRAQLWPGHHPAGGPAARLPIVMLEPMGFGTPREVLGAQTLTDPTPLDTVAPATITTSPAELVTVAAEILDELVAESGSLPTSRTLRSDGLINPANDQRARALNAWARAHQRLAT